VVCVISIILYIGKLFFAGQAIQVTSDLSDVRVLHFVGCCLTRVLKQVSVLLKLSDFGNQVLVCALLYRSAPKRKN
jgi:hypothetical protein